MFLTAIQYLHITEKKIVWTMVFFLAFTFGLYGYFVTTTIHSIVDRQNAIEAIREISSTIGALEARHSALKGNITHDYANTLGFKEPVFQTFVTRKGLAQRGD